MLFYVGMHRPWDVRHVARAFISVNRLRHRNKPVACADWIMDSASFTELATYGRYRHDVAEYAEIVNRIAAINPGLKAVVAQDYMCEPWIVAKTGLSVDEHQRLTIERYDALCRLVRGVYVMPVLQGYLVHEYLAHIDQYGDRLAPGAYVGVGSVCKRNASPMQVEAVLAAIKIKRPDLRLHGFGIKLTSLSNSLIRECLHSADSMAWSFSARKQGRKHNHWTEAVAFSKRVAELERYDRVHLRPLYGHQYTLDLG